MAYTSSQVSSINAARAANVAAGINAYSGAGATASSIASGRSGAGATLPSQNVNNPNVAFVAPDNVAPLLSNVIQAPNIGVNNPESQKINFGTSSVLNQPNLSGINQGLQVSANDSLKTLTEQKNQATSNLASIFSQYLSAQDTNQAPSGADAFKKAQNETGFLQKQQLVGDLTGQLNQIVATSQAQQIAETGQGRGIPETIIGGRQAQIAREAAILALPVAAQLSVAQGNLAMAESNMNMLFKIYSDDATNAYNAKSKRNESIFTFLTGREKAKLDGIQKQEDRAYAEGQNLLKTQEDFAQMALKNNQGGLAGKLMSLNPQSATYKQDFSKLVSGINDPMMKLDMQLRQAQLAKTQRETALIGQPTAAERKAEKAALQTTQGQNQVLSDKLVLIDSIKSSGGMASRVGTNFLSRTPQGNGLFGKIKAGVQSVAKVPLTLGIGTFGDVSDSVSGKGQQFAGAVHRLTSQEFLDKLIGSKQQGATFGALTDREGDALRAAATQLNDWEIKNKEGLGTGVWNIDEASFNGELDRIKTLAQTSMQRSTGVTLSTEEQSLLSGAFGSSSTAQSPALYYNSR